MEEKEVQKEKNVKLRLTPLNIVSAVFLVIAVWLLLEEKKPRGTAMYIDISGILVGFSFLIAIICFVSDQIFRKFVPELKKIWILECFFVVITILLIVVIKISIY
ncbi:asparagine N-glycosylation enzyme membrane subunit Stt3 [Pedobacter sp. AK017]|uniref:hypothetical protein n=1 Tax=Pedobacter sp. AK017 TaxID=2723073 RepID=UPI00160CBB82|nr:hypothetical protein [Pedobacter sp. AK017]MBB5439427.1 asparagine N-glycosylation enzyme membrane subunit Stt3 [Pedobacter sp. AK017]